MKKATYIKCPRCELNYIKTTDNYCHVCLTELKLAGESTSNDEELELCPVCGQNFISPDQKMCEDCLKQKGIDLEYDDEAEQDEIEERENNSWDDGDDLINSDEDVELIPLSAMEEDDEDDDDESEEEDSDKPSAYDDDFEPAYLDDDDYDDEDDDDDEYDDYDDEDDED